MYFKGRYTLDSIKCQPWRVYIYIYMFLNDNKAACPHSLRVLQSIGNEAKCVPEEIKRYMLVKEYAWARLDLPKPILSLSVRSHAHCCRRATHVARERIRREKLSYLSQENNVRQCRSLKSHTKCTFVFRNMQPCPARQD